MKIAVIPFSKEKMLGFPAEHGGLFRVEYKEEHLKTGAERAKKLLESAIEQNNRVGREKYYFLGKRGELVFEEIKKKQDLMNKKCTRLTLKSALQLRNQPKSQQAVYIGLGKLYGISADRSEFGKRLYTNHANIAHVKNPMWKAYVNLEGRPDELCERITKEDLVNV